MVALTRNLHLSVVALAYLNLLHERIVCRFIRVQAYHVVRVLFVCVIYTVVGTKVSNLYVTALEPHSKYGAHCIYPVSYTHLTLPRLLTCRSRWSPYH